MMYVQYARYVFRHKWYVYKACRDLGLPMWMGILHDVSKFLPGEWVPYAHHFYESDGQPKEVRDETGYYKPTNTGDADFDFAWLLHQKRNKHHWQWWILPEDEGGIRILPMPDIYRKEMLADWIGASMAQGFGSNVKAWYLKNCEKMQLHPDTRRWIEQQLGAYR